MCSFVDIQGFRGNGNRFIIKEISIYKHGILSTHLFDAPYSYNSLDKKYKNQALWLFYNHHGLSWNDGYIPYSRVAEIIYKELAIKNSYNTIIYIKGDEKVQWLREYCNVDATNIETLENCPNLKSMQLNLYNNNNNKSMTQCNVINLHEWYNFYKYN